MSVVRWVLVAGVPMGIVATVLWSAASLGIGLVFSLVFGVLMSTATDVLTVQMHKRPSSLGAGA